MIYVQTEHQMSITFCVTAKPLDDPFSAVSMEPILRNRSCLVRASITEEINKNLISYDQARPSFRCSREFRTLGL